METQLQAAQSKIPECLACGYVDMSTGMLLGVRTLDSHPSEVLDLVAAATADLFQGSNVQAIERMFRRSRGVAEDGNHYFQEIMVLSDNLLHIFLRSRRDSTQAFVVVCRKSANIGMALAKSRQTLADVELAAA